MIVLDKDLKIRLLKAIKEGIFRGEDFPELATELKRIQIEVINSADQVRQDDEIVPGAILGAITS
ncbi:MAG TPA: hypothetical protein PLO24_00825 [Bacteroidales bacterium]|nr:hypothetical protein [Bacteroidales bacterium]HOS71112.1 hypothetical protein [Bacteroidales bacterium]HQH23590.1 hypothetical protein [Bacteroidales bacterium]HQJ81112.1 hypothetical protein [Bacteroidales bacterium]